MATIRSIQANLESLLETLEETPEIENYLNLKRLDLLVIECLRMVESAVLSYEEEQSAEEEDEDEDDDQEEEG